MIEKIVTHAWNNYKKNFAVLLGSFLVSVIIPGIILGVVGLVSFWPLITKIILMGFENGLRFAINNPIFYILIPLTVVGITFFITFPPFLYGFMYVVKNSRTKKRTEVKLIFKGLKIFWKRAILQQILSTIFISLISMPFMLSGFNYIKVTSPETAFLGLSGIFLLWFMAIYILGFLFMFWSAAIVVYNVGVIEGLKRSIKKVSNNLLNSFIVLIIIVMISAIITALENLIPLIPNLLISPLIVCILIEGCMRLKEK